MLDERISMTAKAFLVNWNNIPSPYMVERFNVLADRVAFGHP
jgi:hypothetical protein